MRNYLIYSHPIYPANYFYQLVLDGGMKTWHAVAAKNKPQGKAVDVKHGITITIGPHFPAFGLIQRNTMYLSIFSWKMQENADQNNSEYEYFLRSVWVLKSVYFKKISVH